MLFIRCFVFTLLFVTLNSQAYSQDIKLVLKEEGDLVTHNDSIHHFLLSKSIQLFAMLIESSFIEQRNLNNTTFSFDSRNFVCSWQREPCVFVDDMINCGIQWRNNGNIIAYYRFQTQYSFDDLKDE